MKLAGIIIMIIGLAFTLTTSILFFNREKIVDNGSILIIRKNPNNINLTPLIGLAVTCIGGVVLWQSTKKNIV